MNEIDAYLVALNRETRELIDRLRTIVAASHPLLVERLKWNAPSFAVEDDDRITLGLERKGGVRVVLHRGAKSLPTDGFVFEDVDGLAKWPALDRGVVTFKNAEQIASSNEMLASLCRRWIKQVDGS